MASSGGEMWISLFALEELFEGRATGLGEPDETLWGLLPDALVERVLLFLPKSDQARLRLVCKRWRQLMTSPAFLEETTALSFRHGYPICALPSTSVTCSCDRVRRLEERCKVRRVDFPGFMPPPGLLYKGKAFTKFGLPIIGLHYYDYQSSKIRCWLLNLADQSWRQLPPLRGGGVAPSNSEFWLVQKEGCTNFQVFAMRGEVHYTYFHTFSPGTSTDWQSFKIEDPHMYAGFGVNKLTGWALISGGRDFVAAYEGWRFKSHMECFSTSWPDRELKHMMITTRGPDDDDQYRHDYDEPTYDNIGVMTPNPLPDFPRKCVKLLTDGDSDDVFGYSTSTNYMEDEEGWGVCLYKLDRARGQWECLLFEQLPPGSPCRVGLNDKDSRGQIVGSMVLIQFGMITFQETVEKKIVRKDTLWIMAYNMLDGSCKWSRTLSGLGYDDQYWYSDYCFRRRFVGCRFWHLFTKPL